MTVSNGADQDKCGQPNPSGDLDVAARRVQPPSAPGTDAERRNYTAGRVGWGSTAMSEEERGRNSVDDAEAAKAIASVENNLIIGDPTLARSTGDSTSRFQPTGFETLVDRTVTRYLASIIDNSSLELRDIRDGLLQRINAELSLENRGRKESKSTSPTLSKIQVLDELTVVKVLLARHRIVTVDLTGGNAGADSGVLAIYEDFGTLEGLYNDRESRIMTLISELRPSLLDKGLESAFSRMRKHAPVVRRTIEPHLIPVANGVFDHSRMELRPFSPDWVFLSKAQVEYDPKATSPVITNPDNSTWEVEEWMASLSDDEGVPELLWEILSFVVRPHVACDKSAFLVGPNGNGGKGTVLALMRNVVGENAHASVPLVDFAHPFKKSKLIRASVNLVDENDVGAFAESLGDWKACVTGDVITLDRKYKDPVVMRWDGRDVQCFNTMAPRMKDKSESLKRRVLVVPMLKSFRGIENKLIKRDYLQRADVLRYVLKRALHMTHTELSNPPVCEEALEEWFGTNNKVIGFWREFEVQFQWDLLPWAFLYDLYKEWFSRVEPNGKVEGYKQFIESLKSHLDHSQVWTAPGTAVRPGKYMGAIEPLIAEFELRHWMNQSYTGSDPAKKCITSPLKDNYRGLQRTQAAGVAPGAVHTAANAEEEPS